MSVEKTHKEPTVYRGQALKTFFKKVARAEQVAVMYDDGGVKKRVWGKPKQTDNGHLVLEKFSVPGLKIEIDKKKIRAGSVIR